MKSSRITKFPHPHRCFLSSQSDDLFFLSQLSKQRCRQSTGASCTRVRIGLHGIGGATVRQLDKWRVYSVVAGQGRNEKMLPFSVVRVFNTQPNLVPEGCMSDESHNSHIWSLIFSGIYQ